MTVREVVAGDAFDGDEMRRRGQCGLDIHVETLIERL